MMEIIKQYQEQARKFALSYDVDNDHITSIIASVMMTRDKTGIQGGGFVQAVVNNDLFGAISRADITCQKHIKVIVAANQYSFL